MDDIAHCYNTLGLEPGAPQERVKQAYRDLVNVWHPDRFAHDSRLQTKAQQKLSDINRAYERLETFFREPELQGRASQPHHEPERDRCDPPESEKARYDRQEIKEGRHNPFEEYFGFSLRRKSPREFAYQLDAALERYESKLRAILQKVGWKLPRLTSEGRIKGLLLFVGALYLVIAGIYILLFL